jgi:UDP-glucose 4-epimerase
VSSAAVFGAQDKLPISDNSSKNPINPLGHSQLLFEEMLYLFRIAHGISYAVMRTSNLSGLSDGEHKHFIENWGIGWIPSIMECPLGKHEQVNVYGTSCATIDGTASRDYLHITEAGITAECLTNHRVAFGKFEGI